MAQTLAFSYLLVAWYKHPRRAWSIVMGILVVLILLMSLAGVLLPPPTAR